MHFCPSHTAGQQEAAQKSLAPGEIRLKSRVLKDSTMSLIAQVVELCAGAHKSHTMSEKKRKRASHDAGHRTGKMVATEPTQEDLVKVSMIAEEDEWALVVGMIVCAFSLHQFSHTESCI